MRISFRNIPMKSSKSAANKKCKPMDYTNYAYNEAVSRLKLMLAESYAPPRGGSGAGSAAGGGSGVAAAYLRHGNEDSTDNYSDNLSVIERPIYSDISKYLSPAQKSRFSPGIRTKPKPYNAFSKDNLTLQMPYTGSTTTATVPLEYYTTSKSQQPAADSVHAPVEIFNFIEKQEDYIEQLEKESKYCRNELSNLLGKVKDVINENTHLTETARSELATLSCVDKTLPTTSPSSDSDERQQYKKKASTTPRSKKDSSSGTVKSPRYASAPNIVYEARISELEAELMQSNIDLKRLKTENEELKRKLAHVDPLVLAGAHAATPATNSSAANCDAHRKQIDHLQQEKNALEDSVRQLQKMLDEAKSQQYQSGASSKRYISDLVQMERSQAELEVKHLREELDRQHERVRELQHEMARRIADERANAERRYNTQVDQLGGDLSNQWEQVAKLQLDLEREKRYANDLKRDLSNRNAQIDELKMELRSNRNTFLADMAQANAEKQSLEQEITSLRLQLDRAAREAKTEATRLTAEISSLRQRLDRGDADLLHSKREVLRLNDEIANLEKELAYGEMKNEIRPTKKDLDKRMTEMHDKHAETVNELENMIQNQKQLMDKLTSECKTLTSKLEDTAIKHKTTATTMPIDSITTTKLQPTTSKPTTTRQVPCKPPTVWATTPSATHAPRTRTTTPTPYVATTTTTTSGVAWSVPTHLTTTCSQTPAMKTTTKTKEIVSEATTKQASAPAPTPPTTSSSLTGTKPKIPLATSLAATSGNEYVLPPKSAVEKDLEAVDTHRSRSPAPKLSQMRRRHGYGSDEDILANITKSNERLERELAKMPPLPTLPLSVHRRQQRCAHLRRTPSAFLRRSASDEGGGRGATKTTNAAEWRELYGTHGSCSTDMKHLASCTHFEPIACTCCCSANNGESNISRAPTGKQTQCTDSKYFSDTAYTLGANTGTNVDTTTATKTSTAVTAVTTKKAAFAHSFCSSCHNYTWDAHAVATITTPTATCKTQSRLKGQAASGTLTAETSSIADASLCGSHPTTSVTYSTPAREALNTTAIPPPHCGTHFMHYDKSTAAPKLCTSCNPLAPAAACSSTTLQPSACYPHVHCKTEPLPWLQQHLVLNQTFSGLERQSVDYCHACQSPSQGEHLTAPTESKAKMPEASKSATKSTASREEAATRLTQPSYKPRTYFEELLRRDKCCAVKRVGGSASRECVTPHECVVAKKKPRPPVKVDVNVRLVPKPGREHKEKVEKDTAAPREVKVQLTEPAITDAKPNEREREEVYGAQDLPPAIDIPDLPLDDEERQQLRETNEKLMDRLKQIWASYKELHMEREKSRKQLSWTRPNGRQRSASDTAESTGEEHFSALANTRTTATPMPIDSITTTKPQPTTSKPTTTRQMPCTAPTVWATKPSATRAPRTRTTTPTPYVATTTTTTSGVAWSVPTHLTTTCSQTPAMKTTTKSKEIVSEATTKQALAPAPTPPTTSSSLTGTKPKIPLATSLAATSGNEYVLPPKSAVEKDVEAVDTHRSRSPAPKLSQMRRRHGYGSDEDILANITKSNERLERELAKMPPLPTLPLSVHRRQQRCGHLHRTPSAFLRRSASDEGGGRGATKTTNAAEWRELSGTHGSCSTDMKHLASCTHFEPIACTCCCSANNGESNISRAPTGKQTQCTDSKYFSDTAYTLGANTGTNVDTTTTTKTSTAVTAVTTKKAAVAHSFSSSCHNYTWDAHAVATVTTPTATCETHSRLKGQAASGTLTAQTSSIADASLCGSHPTTSVTYSTPAREALYTTAIPSPHCGSHFMHYDKATAAPKLCTSCNPLAPAAACSSTTLQPSACYPHVHCKTEPLPWLQQHLVLNQTFSGLERQSVDYCHACQSPSQGEHLTAPTESKAKMPEASKSATKSTASREEAATRLTQPSYKPRTYFEELLRRDECCAVKRVGGSASRECVTPHECVVAKKKPRPPVKVDVNVRLVPKPGREHKERVEKDTAAPREVKVQLTEPAIIDAKPNEREREEVYGAQDLPPAIDIPDLPLDDEERQQLRETNEKLMDRLKQIWASYKELHMEREKSRKQLSWTRPNGRQRSASDTAESAGEEHFSARTYSLDKVDDYSKSSPYNYDSILGKSGTSDTFGGNATTSNNSNTTPATTTAGSLYNKPAYDRPPTVSGDANNDYNSSYNNKYGLNDPDDENIKDNLGEGEKRRNNNDLISGSNIDGAISSADPIKSDYDYTKDYSKDYDKDYTKDYSKEYTAGDVNTGSTAADLSGSTTDPNVAAPITGSSNDYNTDYSGYEGYGQQQYDASAYDVSAYDQSAYDGSQQQYGTAGQYDTSGQSGYDTSGGQGGYADYSATDYDQSAYQYESTPAVAASGEGATATAASENIKTPPATTAGSSGSGGGVVGTTPTPTPTANHHQIPAAAHQPAHQSCHLPVESPRTLLAAQQRRAAINLERAVALWGQEVPVAADQSAEENPICHNSLPRPPPKSSCAEWVSDGVSPSSELCDPFELEFTISSPSLMRSFGSGSSCTEVENNGDFDSISEMSISPAQTAIRRITVMGAEAEERAVNANGGNGVAEQRKAEKGRTI
ncbi:LOW QUALITY PROTEIN: uncharacterized protein LOC118740479 [Rhagoletis pomonella]|uniref:LOW QUALITY PROTEIN: uncharacterized protein LOC118740479 n=1 Tax=Rhagoletis pomonella TaxID=28610 RepID=UPI001780B8C0|nr:LOW QUALITY PROTEIN: uncharacterized protein LOC118740479 [Rhagoletis pomonella]